ncbi:MAG TPA: hypothetical protein DHW84_12025, partial [Firmicutes bacterium]|nr:hypothetical protein [Bacillota bacterium]
NLGDGSKSADCLFVGFGTFRTVPKVPELKRSTAFSRPFFIVRKKVAFAIGASYCGELFYF